MNENFQNANQPTPVSPQQETRPQISEPVVVENPHATRQFFLDLFAVLFLQLGLFLLLIPFLLQFADSLGVSSVSMIILMGSILLTFIVPALLYNYFHRKKEHVNSWGAIMAILVALVLAVLFLIAAGSALS